MNSLIILLISIYIFIKEYLLLNLCILYPIK